MPVVLVKPKFPQYSRNLSSPRDWPILMRAGLQEFITARRRVWVPWPLRAEQRMSQSPMWTLPVQTKVLLSVMVPSSRPAATTMGLKVEPGS